MTEIDLDIRYLGVNCTVCGHLLEFFEQAKAMKDKPREEKEGWYNGQIRTNCIAVAPSEEIHLHRCSQRNNHFLRWSYDHSDQTLSITEDEEYWITLEEYNQAKLVIATCFRSKDQNFKNVESWLKDVMEPYPLVPGTEKYYHWCPAHSWFVEFRFNLNGFESLIAEANRHTSSYIPSITINKAGASHVRTPGEWWRQKEPNKKLLEELQLKFKSA